MWPFRSAISDKWKIVLLDVIQKRQEKKAILAAASVRNSAPHQKTTPTRTSRKDKVSVEWVRPTECGNFLSFPVSYWSKLNIWYLAFLLMDMDQVYIYNYTMRLNKEQNFIRACSGERNKPT